jgi:Rhodanese-like domain
VQATARAARLAGGRDARRGLEEESNVTEGKIDAMTLRDMLERGEQVTVVDVRKGEDHAEWSIPGSVHVDAYDALHAGDERAMEGLELPEGTPVVPCAGVAVRVRWPRSSCGVRDTRRSLWGVE